MLSLPVQAELRCVTNAVDIEPFFSAATAEDKQQVEQAINSSVNLVPFGLSASDWKVHRGDLVVEGNIESNQKLIVLGNLTVKGNISTFSLSNPWVILGNVTATNIVTDSPLLITGSINASGLVFIDSYYDNPSTIKGSINARGIFINDIIAPVVASSTNSEFMVRASDKNDTGNVKKALMIINPDAYYWGLINDEDALKEIFKRSNIRMAGNVCNQMKKEALFRPKPSPELVQELQMLDEGNVAAFEGRDIATFDLAIMRTLPRLKGISANLRKQLIVTLRIRTWWGIVICFSLVISGPRWMTLTFFALISFLALKEYCTLISVHFPRWLYLVIPLNYLLIGFNCFELFLLFIPLTGFLILATWRVFVGDPSGFLHIVSAIFWGWIMTVFALSHTAWLLMLPTINIQGGALLVLFLLALTESNNIAQYLWGKSCGRRKVVPKVSPGKTLEGLVGGVITTMIASLIIGPLLTPLNTLQALLAGLLIGISGFCGDVVMSAIKRDIGVKDSGKLLPGHGGLLDRIDSLIFTATVFFYFIRYCCY